MNPELIKDNTEKTWFVGTDALPNADFAELEKLTCCKMKNEMACLVWVPERDMAWEIVSEEVITSGIEPELIDLMKEARKRGYVWIHFDADIETDCEQELQVSEYEVEILRTATRSATVRVKAVSEREAEALTLVRAGDVEFPAERDAEYEVESVIPL